VLISKIYIDNQVIRLPVIDTITSRISAPVEIVNDTAKLYKSISEANDPVQKGKQVLYLTLNKGAFLKDCPGTRFYTCCGYKILHVGTFCNMDCSYCILQVYFHPPVLQYFVNYDDLFRELEKVFASNHICRVGTGEFTDSLMWEPWTSLSGLLIPKFADQNRAVLELKTKTSTINELKGLSHNRKTIVSWSLNSDHVIGQEERCTASLEARLKAAAKCETWDYPLGFHFDPLIIYPGCEEDYRNVVEQIFKYVSADNIVWISLGSLRFMPSLKPIIQKRFPDSKIIYGELISGLDGKMRYFKPLRIALYRKMVSWIKALAPEARIYLCMEDEEVWRKSLGYIPRKRGGLSEMLDESAVKVCRLKM
jgi:spore photoproduct lyase